MNNEQMLAAVLALPDADLMTASKIDDPIDAGTYYRSDTVVRLLAAERERCAAMCEQAAARFTADGMPISGPFLNLARQMRWPNV